MINQGYRFLKSLRGKYSKTYIDYHKLLRVRKKYMENNGIFDENKCKIISVEEHKMNYHDLYNNKKISDYIDKFTNDKKVISLSNKIFKVFGDSNISNIIKIASSIYLALLLKNNNSTFDIYHVAQNDVCDNIPLSIVSLRKGYHWLLENGKFSKFSSKNKEHIERLKYEYSIRLGEFEK